MDTNKLLAITVFCLMALIVSFFIPLFAKTWNTEKPGAKPPFILDLEHWYFTAPISLILSIVLYSRVGGMFLIGLLALVFLTTVLKNSKPLISATLVLLAALVTSYLPWWRITGYNVSLSNVEILSILGVMAIMILGLSWPAKSKYAPSNDMPNGLTPKQWFLFSLFIVVAIIFIPYKGPILDRALLTTWHHWGAYIGPAQLVAEGVYPLRDIPVQYGFGPTVLTALSCTITDCWTGFYWLNFSFVIGFFAALMYAALCLSRQASLPAQIAIVTSTAVCALGWTMYPPEMISPLATPSTSGMRFLPGTLMMAFLVHTALFATFNDATAFKMKIVGHLLWVFGLIWAPEAAIHTTFLWGPFFVWSGVFRDSHPASIRQFFIQVSILFGVFCATLAAFILFYLLAFGEMPLWVMYTAAVRNPPGVLPIDYKATVWVALTCYALWFASLSATHRYGVTDRSTLATWITMLLALVTFTYFLGRSHANNVLNLLPYFAILLIAIRSARTDSPISQMANMLLAGFVGWASIFGTGYYNQARENAGYFNYQNTSISSSMSYRNTETELKFTKYIEIPGDNILGEQSDIREALAYINGTRKEPAEIIDAYMLLDAGSEYGPWSAIHPIATTYFSTSQDRITYLKNVMHRLDKSGWIVIKNDFKLLSIIDEYNSVYERTEELEFGTYTAIRYSPKPGLGTQ